MITTEQAIEFIQTPKTIIDKGMPVEVFHIVQKFPLLAQIDLAVKDKGDEWMFTWQIDQGKKDSLRMSLHCQQYESNIGLIRVDYNRGHRNPAVAPDDLPEFFLPYVGKYFEVRESHVHIHVSSDTRQMEWAMPIEASDIETKSFDASSESIEKAIQAFAKAIHITTKIKVERSII